MRITCVEIQNFRRLKSIRVDLSEQYTTFVGANNSGKTSALVALGHFLIDPTRFSPKDFSLSSWQHINIIGQSWVRAAALQTETDLNISHWVDVLPTMDVWLDVNPNEIHMVSHLIPTLDWSGGLLGVRLRLEPSDLTELSAQFVATEKAAREAVTATEVLAEPPNQIVKLWPQSLPDFLDRRLGNHFTLRSYLLDPVHLVESVKGKAVPQPLPLESEALETDPFRGLIRINEIDAQRGFTDRLDRQGRLETQEESLSGGPNDRYRLSRQLRAYYHSHIDPGDTPGPSDVGALQAIHVAQEQFDLRLKEGFTEPLRELEQLGYPGITDPSIELSTKIRPIDGLNHPAAVQYDVTSVGQDAVNHGLLRLPEESIGLGYQNLISMVFRLMRFRDAWMRVGKAATRREVQRSMDEYFPPPIHLVIVEEPEAHLHAQVQQVFIRHAYDVLRNHPDLKASSLLTTQLVVSTHSSHIAHESRFSSLRYFRRVPAGVHDVIPTSTVTNLSTVFGPDDDTQRFVARYLQTTHCDLFFADAVILLEGTAERIMIPHFIRKHYPKLNERYISLLEIGGSHAHRLRPLVETLRIPTLIITDLDSAEAEAPNRKVQPCRNQGLISRNPTLKTWLPCIEDLDSLIDLPEDQKIHREDELFEVRVVYQCPTTIRFDTGSSDQEVIASTFEDALAYENLETFRTYTGSGPINSFKEVIVSAKTVENLVTNLPEAVRKITKAEFALDLLDLEPSSSFSPPGYIGCGLMWLQKYLDRTLRDVMPQEHATE